MAEILSVGIDIGTTTTQVIFSKLHVENTAAYFSVPRVSIVDKQVVFKGDIRFTPFQSPLLIDGDRVRDMVAQDFRSAGFSPSDVGTGAVIITGEAARKENAAIVLEKLSDFAGEFVVSIAGPDLEAILAGQGSGAQQYSKDNHCSVVNLDIGGGTTNLVYFDSGDVKAKGCLDIGGRLIYFENGTTTVAHATDKAKLVAKTLGISLEKGRTLRMEELERITCRMNGVLEEVLGAAPPTQLLHDLRTAESTPFEPPQRVNAVCFSGGVAHCMHKDARDQLLYGDIGVLLGRAIAGGKLVEQCNVIGGSETIRATVVGAGTYTTAISGSTITLAGEALPVKNVPVLFIDPRQEQQETLEQPRELAKKIRWFQEQTGRGDLVLGFRGQASPSWVTIESMAAGILTAMEETLPPGCPILLVVEADIAKALGQAIQRKQEQKRCVISIDAIRVRQGDYVDIGKPLMDGLVVPVVVKTLVFESK